MLKVIITNRYEAKELKIMLEKSKNNAIICDRAGKQIGCYFSGFGFRSSCHDAMSAMSHYYNLMAMKAERDWVELTRPTR